MSDIRIVDSVPIGYFPNDAETLIEAIEKRQGEDITIEISNLGGSLNTALQLYRAIKKHDGKTTCVYVGLNASAATIIGTAADKIVADETAFILIHKVLQWVDVWGYMNEDGIDGLIDTLSKIKDEQGKFNAVLASLYSKRTGKDKDEVMDLMKEDKFLTAEEAKQYGLVDEIEEYEDIFNSKNFQELAAVASKHGLPSLPKPQAKPKKKNKMKGLLNQIAAFFVASFGITEEEATAKANEFVAANNEAIKTDLRAMASDIFAEVQTEVKTLQAEVLTLCNEIAANKSAIEGIETVDLSNYVQGEDLEAHGLEFDKKLGEIHTAIANRTAQNNGEFSFLKDGKQLSKEEIENIRKYKKLGEWAKKSN